MLAEVDSERMLEPGLPGGWSLKDVIAHVNWYEQEMVVLLETQELAGSELWELPAVSEVSRLFFLAIPMSLRP